MNPTLPDTAPPAEAPLSSVESHRLFGARTALYPHEIARVLNCTERHVLNLIMDFELTAGASGLKGFSIGRATRSSSLLKTPRSCWRVAVSDYDAFIARRRDSHQL